MRSTFADLIRLMSNDPPAYAAEIERLRIEDPERLDKFVDHFRQRLAKTVEAEDHPLTADEVESVLASVGQHLGWPRARVLSEAALRLFDAIATPGFRAMSPDPDPGARKGTYLRRRSSVRALILGDVKLLLEQRSK